MEDVTEVTERDRIAGSVVKARSPWKMTLPNDPTRTAEVAEVDECLLENGDIVYQCNGRNVKPHATCYYWSANPVSVRSHLRSHSDRVLAKNAIAQASEAEAKLAELQARLNASHERRSNGSKRGWAARKTSGRDGVLGAPKVHDAVQLKGMRTAGTEGLIETIQDGLDEIEQSAKRARLLLTQVVDDINALQAAAKVDPAIEAKAKKWDALEELRGTLNSN